MNCSDPDIKPIKDEDALKAYFEGLVQRNFSIQSYDSRALHWPDIQISTYVTELLARFINTSNLSYLTEKNQNNEEHPITSSVHLLQEAEYSYARGDFDREKAAHKSHADLILFMAGLFPEYMARLKLENYANTGNNILTGNNLIDHMKVGKRSYAILADDSLAPDTTLLFGKLSNCFEDCVAGLSFVKSDIERNQGGFNQDSHALSV